MGTRWGGCMVSHEIVADGDRLIYIDEVREHELHIRVVGGDIEVGCTKLTREAWELLKRKVDAK